MDILDSSKIAQIGALVLVVVQFIKKYISDKYIPDKYIPVVSIVIGILIAFLFEYKEGKFDIVSGIVNGALGAIGADTSYGFLSKTKSPAFTLSSRTELQEKSKDHTILEG